MAYPLFYAIGFAAVKIVTLGRAKILPLTEDGYEKEMRWYQFFVYRFGVRFWTPESVMLAGIVACGLLGYSAWFVWKHV
ncbi:hypothetical protein [Opitutus terrae]|uniref:hypothetical protein n=1 Tax=Opitutus terrae TaxID=107709 RepID=UPI0003233C5A|nr:hypothetical protein [Opitutus terrae]